VSNVLVRNTLFTSNVASSNGGALFISQTQPPELADGISLIGCTLSNNSGLVGSAVFVQIGTMSGDSVIREQVYQLDWSGTLITKNRIPGFLRASSAAAVTVSPGPLVQEFGIGGFEASGNAIADVACSKSGSPGPFAFCTPDPCQIMDCNHCDSACVNTFWSSEAGKVLGSSEKKLCLNGFSKECDKGQCMLHKLDDEIEAFSVTCQCDAHYKGPSCEVYTCGLGDCLVWIPLSIGIVVTLIVLILASARYYRYRKYQSLIEPKSRNSRNELGAASQE